MIKYILLFSLIMNLCANELKEIILNNNLQYTPIGLGIDQFIDKKEYLYSQYSIGLDCLNDSNDYYELNSCLTQMKDLLEKLDSCSNISKCELK